MTVWGFKSKDDALRALTVSRQAGIGDAAKPLMVRRGLEWIVRTPASGIPAQIEGVAGSATCGSWFINTAGSLVEEDGISGPIEVKVYNVSNQNIDGDAWAIAVSVNDKVVIGNAGGEGGGGTPRIQYVIMREYSQGNDEGIWVAKALLVVGGSAPNPDGGSIVPGSEFFVFDPHNHYPLPTLHQFLPADLLNAGYTGSIGWAVLRTPSNSGNVPPGVTRWEIEQQSLPARRLRVWFKDCLLHPDVSGTGENVEVYFNLDEVPKVSTFPGVDIPRGVVCPSGLQDWDCKMWASNNHKLTAVSESYGYIELWPQSDFSLATTTVPHAGGSDTPVYFISSTEKQIARWVKAQGVGGEWSAKNKESDPTKKDVREGYDPWSEGYGCFPQIDGPENCADEGEGWAFYKPENHAYEVISTESALLGAPMDIQYVSFAGYNDGCGLTVKYHNMQGFCDLPGTQDIQQMPLKTVNVLTNVGSGQSGPCATAYATASIKVCDFTVGQPVEHNPPMQRVKVITAVYGSGNDICYTEGYVYACAAEGGGGGCIDICDLICDCYSNYAQPDFCVPPPPPPCEDSKCQYTYDAEVGRWVLFPECPDLILCECPPPPLLDLENPPPDGFQTPLYNCGNNPPPDCDWNCNSCTQNGVIGFAKVNITGLTHVENDPQCDGAATSPATFTLGPLIASNNCQWTFAGSWNQAECGVSPCQVTITKSGNNYEVAFGCESGFGCYANTCTYTYTASDPANNCQGTFVKSGQTGGLTNSETASLTVTPECWFAATALVQEETTELVTLSMGKTTKSNGLGDLFRKAYYKWFASCGCTAAIVPVMNRWKSIDDLSDSKINTIVDTLANKNAGVEKMTIQIALREFAEVYFRGKE